MSIEKTITKHTVIIEDVEKHTFIIQIRETDEVLDTKTLTVKGPYSIDKMNEMIAELQSQIADLEDTRDKALLLI